MVPPVLELISTDFDGTLHADCEDPPVPLDLQELLAEFQARGAKWVINTGRDLPSVMEGMARARMRVRPDYVVTVEREIFVHEDSQYVPCVEWNRRCTSAHASLFERIAPDVPRLMKWVGERFRATLYEDAFSPFCLIAENAASADEIQVYLEEYCRKVPELTVVRNDIYARFSHVNYNKGTALGEIARQLGVAVERVFAAGDHLNDLPMLSTTYAGHLAAPDNAIPAVKQAVRGQGGYVSHQPWGHGVARALERFLSR
ncbi:MAG TPA: HAD hydrolase family protein [Methylomirabilota bacterium]|nr:HAD hydrolase family protein [Methylomirabilota bacterium]